MGVGEKECEGRLHVKAALSDMKKRSVAHSRLHKHTWVQPSSMVVIWFFCCASLTKPNLPGEHAIGVECNEESAAGALV